MAIRRVIYWAFNEFSLHFRKVFRLKFYLCLNISDVFVWILYSEYLYVIEHALIRNGKSGSEDIEIDLAMTFDVNWEMC